MPDFIRRQLQTTTGIRPEVAPWKLFNVSRGTLLRRTGSVNRIWRLGELTNSFNPLHSNKLQNDHLSHAPGKEPGGGRFPAGQNLRPPAPFRTKTRLPLSVGWPPPAAAPYTHRSLADRWPQNLSNHWNHSISKSRTMILPLLGESTGVRADVQSTRQGWISVQKHKIRLRCRPAERTREL